MGQRPNVLTPEASPRHAWGARLRQLRSQSRPRVSCELLGERIYARHYAFKDRSWIARIERGECAIPPAFPPFCDEALGTTGELTALYEATVVPFEQGAHVESRGLDVDSSSSPLASSASDLESLDTDEDVVVPARTASGEVLFVSISRRKFIAGVGAGVAGVAAIAGAGEFTAAVPTRALSVDYLSHFEQMRLTLVDSDNLFGAVRVLPTVKEQIAVMRQLRATGKVQDLAAHMRLQAQFAEFAGWLNQDGRQYAEAQRWTDQALTWSYPARDRALTSFILARRSQLAGDVGDGADAVDAAVAATEIAPHGRLAAIAETFGAHGHALLGDHHSAEHAYERAREQLAGAEGDTPWGQWLDDSYISVNRARSLSALGRHGDAVDTFDHALRELPSSFHRDRGVYLARAGAAHARAGDVDQACSLGVEALEIGVDTNSGRIVSELSVLHDGLRKWHKDPRVTELNDALRAVALVNVKE